MDKPDVQSAADKLYSTIQGDGMDVLYDDRDESPGVKFNDADLLGMPVRLTVSPRNLKSGSVEFTERVTMETRMVPLDDVVAEVKATLVNSN
jgi:prolyl-tRNA synthetase